MKTTNFQIEHSPSAERLSIIRAGLVEHNTPHLEGCQREDFAFFSYDENGKENGGIYADIWGNWLYTKFLWVDKSTQGKGIGKQLLEQVEEYARSQGCKYAHVATCAFQAKPFYEKCGYECKYTLPNYPHDDSCRYELFKDL